MILDNNYIIWLDYFCYVNNLLEIIGNDIFNGVIFKDHTFFYKLEYF